MKKMKSKGSTKEPQKSMATSHNDMYKPKGMNIKDNMVSSVTFSCNVDKTMFPKNDMV